MSSQNANSVAITGGAISGTSITVKDNVFTLQDDIDPTKQAQFQLSSLTTGVTFSYVLPLGNGSASNLVDQQSTQTLTGIKTFSGGVTFSAASGSYGTNANASTYNYASGATTTGLTKTVNFGTSGLSGSTTEITFGSANGSTTTMLGSTVIGGASGNQSLQVNNVASAVNYLQVVGATTGNGVDVTAQGTDANIGLNIKSKGNFNIPFYTGGGAQFQVVHTASAVNRIDVTGAATTAAPTISAQGSDANISLAFLTKGAGGHIFSTGGGQQFTVGNIASAVNYLQASGAPTGSAVGLNAQGVDASISMGYFSKALGFHFFYTGGIPQASISPTSSAVNRVNLTGAATGGAPELSAQGSDTNINLKLTTKGTGVLQFGTYTATVLSPTGFITVTDAAGTSRRLLVG